MNPNQLLTHFDRLADAPDAVRRLRRFILDLAVRGKLVEQDPKDEPAAELLKRIQAEKARLANIGEIRKEKPYPAVSDDDAPFLPPRGWEWVRIRQVTSDRGQTIPESDLTYIDVTAINKEAGRVEDARIISADDAPSRARKLVRTGDVIYSCVRPYLLNIAIVEKDFIPPPIASTAFAVLNGFGLVLSRYLWIALRSPFMVECVEKKMRGQAYPAINDSDFALLPLPLPPLAEQRRIVAKVDELMALCDRLEAAQAERQSRRDRLVRSSLHRLNQPADGPAFRDDARFTLEHLPQLTARPEHVPQLRQTILNLAVRGKLVPQEPNEESGQELLARIRAANGERSKLRDGDEALTNLAKIEEFGELPKTWVWTRLRDIADISAGSTPSRDNLAYWHGGKVPWVASGATSESIIMEASEYVTEEGARAHRLRLYPPGTLLVALYGQGKTRGQVATLGISATINQACAAICSFPGFEELLSYVKLILLENYDRVRLNSAGGPQPNLNGQKIKEVLVPLPPLAEQRRIVAKVDELMALCDRLEMQLTTAQTERRRLLESVLHEALAFPRL